MMRFRRKSILQFVRLLAASLMIILPFGPTFAESPSSTGYDDNYTAANSQNTSYVDRTGLYMQGNIGTNIVSFSWLDTDYNEFGGVGLNAILGYQYNDYIGVEGGYTRYFMNGDVNDINVLDIAATLSLPFGPLHQFVIFGKIGPAYGFNKQGHAGLLYGGVGAGYAINPKIDLVVQTQGETLGFASFALISAGLSYHFGNM